MINISHLSYSFGKKEILSDISMSIEEGSFHAILGANGCGKTTLLRCISNLLPVDKGQITIDNRNVQEYGARMLARKIALVPQRPAFDLEFSAFETVLMGRNPYQRHLQNESQQDWDIVEQCMKQTNTWHLRLAMPSQMSGGELQRVMIARALAQKTPILLLDEPTSSLDIEHQLEIMRLLKTINAEEGKTILIVVHDLNLALRYCPNTILLHNKKIFFQGPTSVALSPQNVKEAFHVDTRIIDNHIIVE
ncbi:MAG: ABC transporter ATP-binding protein [Bacteroidales bacterium]|nr:ABC transporter ATP-binding protein [Bacteroidales bacterium]MCR5193430.1 ABC transporter ATP-binding protein [Bacteroidales bacterium]